MFACVCIPARICVWVRQASETVLIVVCRYLLTFQKLLSGIGVRRWNNLHLWQPLTVLHCCLCTVPIRKHREEGGSLTGGFEQITLPNNLLPPHMSWTVWTATYPWTVFTCNVFVVILFVIYIGVCIWMDSLPKLQNDTLVFLTLEWAVWQQSMLLFYFPGTVSRC